MLKKALYACIINLIVVGFVSIVYFLTRAHYPYCEHTPQSVAVILVLIHITATLAGIFIAQEEDK